MLEYLVKLMRSAGFGKFFIEQEALLTTFISPSGRYCFQKLPFGISSDPELFQWRMSQVLSGIAGALYQMDDAVIFGHTQTEHDARLWDVLLRQAESKVTHSPIKCLFIQDRMPSTKTELS